MGTEDVDDDEEHARRVVGAMALVDGLLELTRIRKSFTTK